MMRSTLRASLAGVLLVAMLPILAMCQSSPALAQTTLTDHTGREVRISDSSKIISIGGDITEILYAIGAEKRIVAVDSTSQFPPRALKEKKDIGYLRALSTEGVLSVDASLIIASDRTGPPEVVKALKASPVPYFEIREEYTRAGLAGKVRTVSRVVGLESAGENLATQIERDFAALDKLRASITKPVRALFVLTVANGRATVGGADTSADAILKLAGAVNAAASVPGFKPLSDEALVELQPDAIVTMRRTNSGAHDVDQLTNMKGMSATPAVANNRIITMDGLYMLGFGPRTAAAALELMQGFYPDLASARIELGK
jgi:iron complex transport system substrate-binding protein